MYEEDTGLGRVLESAALPAAPSAARAQAVHERMRELTRTPVRRQRRWPAVVASGLLVIGAGTFGVAGTETGRALVRYLFTKIEPAHGVTGTQPDGSSWSVVRHGPGAEPFSPAEAQAVTAQMDEIAATKQAGGGRLAQVIESPGHPSIPGAERIFTTYVIEYTLADGRRIYLLAEGRLVNLSAAEGHPAAVMDMSFANQSLSAEFMVRNHATLETKVYGVPAEIDAEIARLKLASMGVGIDTLTEEQARYLASWDQGT